MNIQEINGINYQINSEDLTASVVDSPKASGLVVIPHHIRYLKKNYIITTIESNAFSENIIESLTFANNSEVSTFEDGAFQNSSIKKLQIPPKLQSFETRSFFLLKNLIEFDISPNNFHFLWYHKELLIGKSEENQSSFDVLYFGRSDLKTVIIPSSIRIMKRYSFGQSPDLEEIKFEENSQLEYIEGWVLCENLKKIEIPRNLKDTEEDAFRYAYVLTDIKVSPENKVYSMINNTFLIKNKKERETIVFCRRDVIGVEIPRCIKEIGAYSFSKCDDLVSISFETESSLEIINKNAFENVPGPKSLIIPSSVKLVKSFAFSYMENITSIEFLSEEIEIEINCFYSSSNLTSISFPNAKKIIYNDFFGESTKIYIKRDAIISGTDIDENQNNISILDVIDTIEDKLKTRTNENIDHLKKSQQTSKEQMKTEKEEHDLNHEINKNTSRCCLLI